MGAHSVEDIKQASGRLRGTLLESLANPVTGALAEADQVLIKYHGSYQQDDRDIREERRVAKLEPDYSFMIRTSASPRARPSSSTASSRGSSRRRCRPSTPS